MNSFTKAAVNNVKNPQKIFNLEAFRNPFMWLLVDFKKPYSTTRFGYKKQDKLGSYFFWSS